LRMKQGRTGDVDEIRRLALKHQIEVVIYARVLEHSHRKLATLGYRIVHGDDRNVGPREPSCEMPARGDLAESGNDSSQLHIQARAISSSSAS